MSESLSTIANVAILTFVLASMASLGLSLTVGRILRSLSDLRLIALGLVANFVAAPALAWGVSAIVGLDDSLTLGLVLLGTAAGAPFLPKLAQVAEGDVAFSVGLMVLLMSATIAFVPLVLMPLVDGVDVSAWDIARPLVVFMLIPLVIALAVRARYPAAERLAAPLGQVATTTLAIGAVVALGLALPDLTAVVGTGAFAASTAFVVLATAAGFVLGGTARETRLVTALGTGQRNVSAALLIATTSFGDDPTVFVMVAVGAVLMLVILLPLAAELGRRAPAAAGEAT